ncbi:hypothetical protein [Lysobacter enzymogenes]|uniref:hypothetical protein n=1 Tax=Lysobacter enzymogenes TaxID=69 RepID=UPI001AF0BEA2|nr:hypothetical protein [Lysobacter enzymogenes]QQQ01607.1 hypothetical protein JHW41_01080 [Lysobacter enzymogenes]
MSIDFPSNPLGNLLSGLGGGASGLPGGLPLLGGNGPGLPGMPSAPGEGDNDPQSPRLPSNNLPGSNGQGPGGLPGTPGTPGLPGGGLGNTPVGTAPAPGSNAPLINPDNPLSRMLQGSSPSAYNHPFGNGPAPTQYPAPTLSERAFNAAQYALLDRGAVPAAASSAASAGAQGQSLPAAVGGALPGGGSAGGAAAGAAAHGAATTAQLSAAPASTLAAANVVPNAVAGSPAAAALSQDALIAQQALLARLPAGTHAVAGNTAAAAAAPPSETAAALPAVGTHTTSNDPRNLPAALNDRAVQQRGDGPNASVYTGDTAARRAPGRGRVSGATLTHWLWRFGRGGAHRPSHDDTPEVEAVRALQWLFWVLTVVAYVCLAMAVVLLLPGGSFDSQRIQTGGSGAALALGVAIAAGAWWLGRRINKRP